MCKISKGLSSRFKNATLLCSFLVVIIHCISNFSITNKFLNSALHDGFCRVAVPFFFFASGFFLAEKVGSCSAWAQSIQKRIKSLLVPYFIFVIGYWLLRNGLRICINLFEHRTAFDGINVSCFSLLSDYGLNVFEHPLLSPAWYIRGIFALILLSPILLRLSTKWGLLLLFILYGLIGPWEDLPGRWVYFFRKTIPLQGAFYFTLGMSTRLGRINVFLTNQKLVHYICAFGGGLMVLKIVMQICDISYYYYAGFLAVPLLLVGMLNLMPSYQLPKWMTSAAFPIYMIHLFVIMVFKNLFSVLHFDLNQHIFVWGSVLIGVFLTAIAITHIIRRYSPKLAMFIFGGR